VDIASSLKHELGLGDGLQVIVDAWAFPGSAAVSVSKTMIAVVVAPSRRATALAVSMRFTVTPLFAVRFRGLGH
jgi:hypothetical protein